MSVTHETGACYNMDMKICFLGGGNMASALIGGLVAKGVSAANLSAVEVNSEARERLAMRFGIRVADSPQTLLAGCDTVVLAVKPQDMRAALAPLAPLVTAKLVISIAAGVRLEAISRWLGGHGNLVRAMPNTPALIGAGITGLYAAPGVDRTGRLHAEEILRASGEVVWVPEERLLDPVTALSGSGPAYVFWFIEQLAASGTKLGLAPETAQRLALETVLGAARLAAQSDETPGMLRERVTSQGGTTEAALKVFGEEKMAERLERALKAASERGAELGDLLGKDD